MKYFYQGKRSTSASGQVRLDQNIKYPKMFILFKCVKSKTMTIQQLKILYLPITLFDKRWQSACYFKISGIPPVSKDHNFLNVVEYTIKELTLS